MKENRHRLTLGTVVLAWLLAVCALGVFLVVASSSSAAVVRDAAAEQPIDYEDGPPVSPAQTEREFDRAQDCRRALGLPLFQTNHHWRIMVGREYRAWLHALWYKRANVCEKQLERANRDPRFAIRLIFRGPGDPSYAYADSAAEQAVRVAYGESRWKPWDRLGQYVGLFQMGDSERAQYGLGAYASGDRDTAAGASIVLQVRSGYRMFVAAGRSWGRWQVRPGSGGETSHFLGW